MIIFINSRGFSRQNPDHEYSWRILTQERAYNAQTILGLPRFQGLSLGDLVESDSRRPSLVLSRSGGVLHLFVTRLLSKRKGSQDERIFNSVLLEGAESDLPFLRGLAADVIRTMPVNLDDPEGDEPVEQPQPEGILNQFLDAAIEFDSQSGFRIRRSNEFEESLREGVAKSIVVPQLENDGFRWSPKHGNNHQGLRLDLAHQLQNPQFPLSDGPLVVVTGVLTVESLVRSGCWRGLTLLSGGVSWQRSPVDWRFHLHQERQELDREGIKANWIQLAAAVFLGRRA